MVCVRLKVGTAVKVGLNQTYNGGRIGELNCLAICCLEGYEKMKRFVPIAFQYLEYAIRKVQVNQEGMKFSGSRSATGLC